MYSTVMIKQIMDVNKKMFEDSLSAMIAIQDHAEKMMHIFWERSTFFPAENKKVVEDWLSQYRSSLDDFKENMDKRFKLMEGYLLNAADQVESSVHTVVNKTVPVSQVYDAAKKPAAKGNKEDASAKRTDKKRKVTIKKK